MEARLFIGLKSSVLPSDRLDFFISQHLLLKNHFQNEEWIGQELTFPITLEECELKYKHMASLFSQLNESSKPLFYPYLHE